MQPPEPAARPGVEASAGNSWHLTAEIAESAETGLEAPGASKAPGAHDGVSAIHLPRTQVPGHLPRMQVPGSAVKSQTDPTLAPSAAPPACASIL